MSASSQFQNPTKSLESFRIKRLRRLGSVFTVVAVIYSLLIIQFTPLFSSSRYLLQVIALAAGTANYLIYRFLPNSFFSPNSLFTLNFINLFVIALVVHLTGGLASPFMFFYILVVFSALTTLDRLRASLLVVFTIELIVAHFFVSPNKVTILSGSWLDLLFLVSRLMILGFYTLLLVEDLFAQEEKNLVIERELSQRLFESELILAMDKAVEEQKDLQELLSGALKQVTKELKSSFGMFVLTAENSPSLLVKKDGSETRVEKVLPDSYEQETLSLVEKKKKTLLFQDLEGKRNLFSVYKMRSLVLSPLIFEGSFLGALVLGKVDTNFTTTDKSKIESLAEDFASVVQKAKDLQQRNLLFAENEKATAESNVKIKEMEQKSQQAGI